MQEQLITGTLIGFGQEKSGTSTNGTWKFTQAILETGNDKRTSKAAVEVWDKDGLMDRVKGMPIGSKVSFYVNIESREYQDKWFTSVKAWKIKE